MNSPEAAPKGTRKAAILLVLLGEDIASQIYRHLPPENLEQLTQAIAELQAVDPKTALAVLEEYHRLDITQEYLTQGGADYAQKLLVKAFGEENARELMKQASYSAEMNSTNLDSLQKSDPQQLAKFLENEHAQTIALILARSGSQVRLGTADAAAGSAALGGSQTHGPTPPGSSLPEIAEKVSPGSTQTAGGAGGTASPCLCRVPGRRGSAQPRGPDAVKAILEAIEKDDPKVALGIRNLMFTFQDLMGGAGSRHPGTAGATGQENPGLGVAGRER